MGKEFFADNVFFRDNQIYTTCLASDCNNASEIKTGLDDYMNLLAERKQNFISKNHFKTQIRILKREDLHYKFS